MSRDAESCQGRVGSIIVMPPSRLLETASGVALQSDDMVGLVGKAGDDDGGQGMVMSS